MAWDRRSWTQAIVVAGLFLALMTKSIWVEPPSLRAHAIEGAFNTDRALARLARILGDETPHPVDTAANDAVRERLLEEIAALGHAAEVRDDVSCREAPFGSSVTCARVRNVVFSIGPEDGEAIVLSSHYDSQIVSPGAADDGIGVAVMLEIAALLSDRMIERPVTFLFSDGEEFGLLGAVAFAQGDPLAARTAAVINLEARGVRGPAAMFETSRPNGSMIRAVMDGAERPVANSMMADVYELLPNSTDMAIYLPRGYRGVNFAVIEGLSHYHTPDDDLASLDPRSVQHMGDLAYNTAKNMLAIADDGFDRRSLVYTDLLTRSSATLSQNVALPLLIAVAMIALAGFFVNGGEAPIRAALAPPAILLGSAALVFALQWLLGLIRSDPFYWWARPTAMQVWIYAGVLLVAALAARELLHAASRRRVLAAAWFWFSLVGIALSILVPGAAILFLLPGFAYAVTAIAGFFVKEAERPLAVAAGFASAAVFLPILHLVEITLGFSLGFAIASVVALLALTWLPVMCANDRDIAPPTLWLSMACGVVAAGGFAAALSVAAATPSVKWPMNVTHIADLDERTAAVAVRGAWGPPPAEMAALYQFAAPEEILAGSPTRYRHAETVFEEPGAAPSVEILSDVAAEDGRRLTLRLASGGAYISGFRIPHELAPRAVALGGYDYSFSPTPNRVGYHSFTCVGRTCDGMELTLSLSGDPAPEETRDWVLFGLTPGVPETLAPLVAARPESHTAAHLGDVSITVARVRF